MKDIPTLVQFGAGNIGRSLVGQLFAAAGWRVVFLDVADAVIDALNAKGRYRITVKDEIGPGQPETIEVANVSGVNLRDRDAAVRAVRGADLVGTSVGAANMPSTCGIIAEALDGRGRDLSVLLCENLHNAARLARGHLEAALPSGSDLSRRAGFVEAAISKMVPSTPPEVRRADPLAVWAEAYNTLYLDADAYMGTPPDVFGVAWRTDFAAYVDRKLLLHNFGHAAAAYNGFLAGKKYIWECMENEDVFRETSGCMMETARALAFRHSRVFTFDENKAWADDLLRRFHNRALADPVFRVGRDLERKLAPEDRCIGALRLLMETGQDYSHTARAVAAGLLFAPDGDGETPPPGDARVVALAAEKGPEAVLTGLCGLDAAKDESAVETIAAEYRRLARK